MADASHLALTRYAVLRSHLDVADEVLADLRDVPTEVLTAMTTAQSFAREGFREAWDALDVKQAAASSSERRQCVRSGCDRPVEPGKDFYCTAHAISFGRQGESDV